MSELLLGIDCGSSVTKAAVFDLEGHELGSSASRTETIKRPDGGVERSSEGIWQSVVQTVRAAVAESGLDPRAVVAIGCSGHGNGLYALDGRGRALPTAYQSLDTRGEAIVEEWERAGFGTTLYEDAWQRIWAGQPLVLLEWLRRHEPERFRSIATILLCKDFVNYRLTGRAVSDYSDMTATGLLANGSLTQNTRFLELVDLGDTAAALPPLVGSTDVIGTVSTAAAEELGLAAGTPVVGGLFDVAASAVGSGGAAEGALSVIAGTWSINAVVTQRPLVDPALLMTTAFADGRRWMAIEASATSAANLSWFVGEAFADREADSATGSVFDRCCALAETAPLRPRSPIYHPFLYGSPLNQQARAGFYGIAGDHTSADLARAVLEGVAFGHRSHVESLLSVGAQADRVRLTGGGARSPFWSQVFADVLGMRIEIPDTEESGARGAALAAGVGAGVYEDIDRAMDRAVRIDRAYDPDLRHAGVYRERFAVYRQLVEAMVPVWATMADERAGPT